MMPPGEQSRAEQAGTGRGAHTGSPRTAEAVIDATGPEDERLDSVEASGRSAARREWDKARRVPAQLRAEIARAAALGEHAWRRRQISDFAVFLPHLEHNVELSAATSSTTEAEDFTPV